MYDLIKYHKRCINNMKLYEKNNNCSLNNHNYVYENAFFDIIICLEMALTNKMETHALDIRQFF